MSAAKSPRSLQWPSPTRGRAKSSHFRRRVVSSFLPRDDDDRVIEAFTWTARGYLRRPTGVIIRGKEYLFVEEVGGFGYVARHEGLIADWSAGISGGGLQPADSSGGNSGMYTVDIEPDEEVVVQTFIEARDLRFTVEGRLGAAIPQGGLSSLVKNGISASLGFEYLFSNRFSGELSLGFHQFDDDGLGDDLGVVNLSANARYYFPGWPVRFFANGGLGIYSLDPGSTEVGANVGVGLQYFLNRRLALDGAYNYHAVDTSNPSVDFSTFQIGLRHQF